MKQFYRFYLLCLFILSGTQLKAQFDSKKYDRESFLIGTLNEYIGYQRTFTNRNDFYYQRVDIMSKNDLKKALFIDSLFCVDFQDIKIVNNGSPMGIKIYSPSLSKRIDNYYDYKPSVIITSQKDTVYTGTLLKEKFDSEKQIMSFLLGCYITYGKDITSTNSIIELIKNEKLIKEDSISGNNNYGFSMSNAPVKAKLCTDILKKLDCKNVIYAYRNSIPTGNFVVFQPSPIIKKMIKDARRLNEYINSIDPDRITFTPDGDKYIWKQPDKISKKDLDTSGLEGVIAEPVEDMLK